jgi:hypothetical protein
MTDETHPFSFFMGRQAEFQTELNEQQKEECKKIEDLLALSLVTVNRIVIRNASKQNNKENVCLMFAMRNILYLLSSYQLITRGLFDPATNNLRTVFETIIRTYEKYNNLDNWTKEEKLESARRKFSPLKLFEIIYCDSTAKQLEKNVYWQLCHASHPSIFGLLLNVPLNGQVDNGKIKSLEYSADPLKCTTCLAISNLVMLKKIFNDILTMEEKEKILELISRSKNNNEDEIVLVPDKEGLV